MDNIAKKRFNKYYDKIFTAVKNSRFYQKVRGLNLVIRIIIFLICVVWFVVGTILVPPIPLGNFALIGGFIVLFPINKVKSKLRILINRFRIKKAYAKWLAFKHRLFRKK